MATRKAKDLVVLIQSMTKGEKKRFTQFSGGPGQWKHTLYLHIFKIYATHGYVDDGFIARKIPALKEGQLSNLRAHLWIQILECLRISNGKKWQSMQSRAALDFAYLLHNRGLHRAAAEMISDALRLAEKLNHSSLTYHILDEKRFLQTEFGTGGKQNLDNQLVVKTRGVIDTVSLRDQLFNTTLQLQQQYYRQGYVKNAEEFRAIREMFDEAMPKYIPQKNKIHENVLYYQARVWYAYTIQDFASCYRYASKWVQVYTSTPALKTADPFLYIKGLHQVLNALFMGEKRELFHFYYQEFCSVEHYLNDAAKTDLLSVYKEYFVTHTCNRIFLNGMYDDGICEIQPFLKLLRTNPYNWQDRKRLTLYYKIACVHFGADDYPGCLDLLNIIINSIDDGSLQDIRSFSRILSLICHYELKNDLYVRYQIKSVYRYLHKMKDLQAVQKLILTFLKNSAQWKLSDMQHHFKQFRQSLAVYRRHPYEKRPFLYLDILSWLDSKVQGRRIQEIIRSQIPM